MKRNSLSNLNMKDVRNHYIARKDVSKELRTLKDNGKFEDFLQLALGISEFRGNYSASDHDLGEKILYTTSRQTVFNLAKRISSCKKSEQMLEEIYKANIPFLKISVGTEIAMMLQPMRFWVANTRTVWAHLLVKHDFDFSIANEELGLYRDQDTSSEMDYKIWREIYPSIKSNLVLLGELADKVAAKQRVLVGKSRYIWFDAIANAIYENR